MKRGLSLLSLTLLAGLPGAACDKDAPPAAPEAAAPSAAPPQTAPSAQGAPSASPVVDAGRVMPPRPVPTSSPTVMITMPMETQLQAIQYMAAMQAPQPSDAPADPDYAKSIASGMRGLGTTDVISSGRLIDVRVPRCDAQLPRQAVARSGAGALGTLLAHGVLVVRCTDKQLQCLQSTRDADDVLCVHK